MRSSGSNRSSEVRNSKQSPHDRALQLLRSFLTEEQLNDLDRLKGFRYRRGDRLYWIPLAGPPSCAFLSYQIILRYCIHTVDESIPQPDQALTFLTWITSAEERFHSWANVIQSRRFPSYNDEEDLVGDMSGQRPIGTGESPYSIYRGPPPPTDSQRRLGKVRARELAVGLRADLIRDRLALIDIGSNKAVDRLAEEWPF